MACLSSVAQLFSAERARASAAARCTASPAARINPSSQFSSRRNTEVRGHRSDVTVPVSYTLNAKELLVQGELPLKQTDLGLTPFTAMLGALAVRDEMQLGFRIVARAP